MNDEILAALARIEARLARLEDTPTKFDLFAAAAMVSQLVTGKAADIYKSVIYDASDAAEVLLFEWNDLLNCAAINREIAEQEQVEERAAAEAFQAKLLAKQAAGIAKRAAKRAAKKSAAVVTP